MTFFYYLFEGLVAGFIKT